MPSIEVPSPLQLGLLPQASSLHARKLQRRHYCHQQSLRGNTELASDCADSYRTVNSPSINTFAPVVPAAMDPTD